MTIDFSQYSGSEKTAVLAVNQLNLEGLTTANVINTFRNVFPGVATYLDDTILSYKARDSQDFDFARRTRFFQEFKVKSRTINFVAISEEIVSAPEGLNSKFIPYLQFLGTTGAQVLKEGSKLLEEYTRVLSNFISNRDAKTSLRDHTAFFKGVEKQLETDKKTLQGFFNVKSTVTALPIYALYDREADIVEAVDTARKLNELRIQTDKTDFLGQVQNVSSLLDLIIQRSKEQAIENVSAAAADNIAQGALALAHYVEFIGVIRYRLEEAITAIGQDAEKIAHLSK